jgi:tRNA uridine 5-carboxymethylaminomethyl modification enzyme
LLVSAGGAPLHEPVAALGLLLRPHVELPALLTALAMVNPLDRQEVVHFSANEKYRGFVERQTREIARSTRLAHWQIPKDFDYAAAKALSNEARLRLARFKPLTVTEAQNISGVTPADISALLMYLQPGAKGFEPEDSD